MAAEPLKRLAAPLAGLAGVVALVFFHLHHPQASGPAPADASASRGRVPADDGAPMLRLSGTVEAVRATTVIVPRLAGQTVNSLVITYLVPAGTKVSLGDVLVEFDPQDQLRAAMDRRAEVVDLDGQIAKKRADQEIARAADETSLAQAENDLKRAKLDLLQNEFIAPVDAEKNQLTVDQDTAKVTQLRETLELKKKAGDADVRVLEIRRSRSQASLEHAEGNSKKMSVHATFAGVAVIKSIYKGNGFSEVQEGDEVRPGLPILDIVDPSAMRVRAKVNQADVLFVEPGRAATIRLDAYPELVFKGRVDVLTPLAETSSLTNTVHTFTALVAIDGTHPKLMPDLTASVDVNVPSSNLAAAARPAEGR